MCVQETKLEKVNKKICSAILGDDNMEWREWPTINTLEGLLCIWNKGLLEVRESFSGDRHPGLKVE